MTQTQRFLTPLVLGHFIEFGLKKKIVVIDFFYFINILV